MNFQKITTIALGLAFFMFGPLVSPVWAATPTHDQTATGNNLTGATSVTALVTTTGTNRVLLATISYNAGLAGANGVSSVSGGGLTWTRVGGSTSTTVTSVEVWRAVASSQLTAQTITVSFGATSRRGVLVVSSYTGVDLVNPTAGTCTGSGTASGTNIPTCSLTAQYTGSLLTGHLAHRRATPIITAGTNYTLNGTNKTTSGTTNNNVTGAQERRTSTVAAGSITVVSFTNDTAQAWAVLGVELRAAPTVTVATSGSQTTSIAAPATGQYVGGAFTAIADAGAATITQLIIKENGSINANSHLSNLKLYYETSGTCTYDGTETLFGTTGSFNGSDQSTITGSLPITTSQICLYAVLDVGSGASNGNTVEIEISNPSTDISISSGSVTPGTTIAISGSTTIQVISVSVTITTDGAIAYGTVSPSSNKSTIELSDSQTVKNDGSVSEDFNIKTSNASGGTAWTLGAAAGINIFVHEFSTNSGGSWTPFTTTDSYQTLITDIAPNATTPLDLRITIPSSSSDSQQKNITVTIQAVQH